MKWIVELDPAGDSIAPAAMSELARRAGLPPERTEIVVQLDGRRAGARRARRTHGGDGRHDARRAKRFAQDVGAASVRATEMERIFTSSVGSLLAALAPFPVAVVPHA